MNRDLYLGLLSSGPIAETKKSSTYPIRRAFDKAGWLKDKAKRKAARKQRKKNR